MAQEWIHVGLLDPDEGSQGLAQLAQGLAQLAQGLAQGPQAPGPWDRAYIAYIGPI